MTDLSKVSVFDFRIWLNVSSWIFITFICNIVATHFVFNTSIILLPFCLLTYDLYSWYSLLFEQDQHESHLQRI